MKDEQFSVLIKSFTLFSPSISWFSLLYIIYNIYILSCSSVLIIKSFIFCLYMADSKTRKIVNILIL